jgi:glycosyltransferase involved in cell wall biosynthesis
MKIFITGTTGESLPPPYAGIPKHTLLLARLWRESGHEVATSFVYRHDHEDDLNAQASYFFEYSKKPTKISKAYFWVRYFLKNPYLYVFLLVRYLRIDRHISKEVLLYTAYGVFLDDVVTTFKPDVLLSEAALIKTFMASQIARKHRIPIVVHTYAEIHDMDISPNKRLKTNPENLKRYWELFLNDINLVLAPSIYCAHGPLQYAPKNKVQVVYFGIDVTKYLNFSETKEDAQVYFKLSPDLFYFVAVGALTLRKGHDHLIQAAAKLINSGEDVGVVLCGPGNPHDLRELAVSEGIADKVFFFTGLSEQELMRLYRATDIYCDASNTPRACLGMSLTEAMVMGQPVVAYDIGGIPEVVFNMQNGLLAPTNDINALAQALKTIKNLPVDQFAGLGVEGRLVAKKFVDIENESKQLTDIFQRVIFDSKS